MESGFIEAVQGEKLDVLNVGIGLRGLNQGIEMLKDNPEFIKNSKTTGKALTLRRFTLKSPHKKGF